MPSQAVGSGFLLRRPDRPPTIDLFLSSGSDLKPERDFIKALVEAASTGLRQSTWGNATGARIGVVRWEEFLAIKTGGDTNALFVHWAKRSHVTVVLVHKDLRKGTKEEVDAALAEDDVQLSVIWLKPPAGVEASRPLKSFLRKHENTFYYNTIMRTPEALAEVIVRVLTASVADVIHMELEDGDFFEQR